MKEIELGRFCFGLEYRRVDGDQGVTLHLYGPYLEQSSADQDSRSTRPEVLRFDCFDNEPHYHIAWSARQDPYIPIRAADSLAWSLDEFAASHQALLQAAGAPALTPDETMQLPAVLRALLVEGRNL